LEAPVPAHLLLLWLLGCNDDYLLPVVEPDIDDLGEGWCAVDSLIRSECLSCHSAAGRLGDLDLETDAHTTLTTASSSVSGLPFVTAGDPAASYLMSKLAGPLEANQGGTMPPGAPFDEATLALVRTWIEDGADSTCENPDTDITPGRHHPTGFALPAEHGPAARLQEEACIDCHGADLTGQGDAVSCDSCHAVGWRTDCTFCHGDPVDGTGSPPLHISGVDDGAAATFIPHRAHTDPTDLKVALDCTECHDKPVDVLSLGHLFVGDTTPARAEVDFTAGLSSAAAWDGNGTCSNLYCHGNRGRDNGTMDHTGTISTCHDCHPDPSSGRTIWGSQFLGENHEEHLREGVTCGECHGLTTNAALDILDPAVHVDGNVQVQLVATMTLNGTTCTGTCHGENHTYENW
jgi:hypothetical protein